MERKKHIETIKTIKKFIAEKDFEGLKKYIELREQEILKTQDEDESSDYLDKLVNQLK